MCVFRVFKVILAFELVAGQPLFKRDRDDNAADQRDLRRLLGWSDGDRRQLRRCLPNPRGVCDVVEKGCCSATPPPSARPWTRRWTHAPS